MTNSLIMAFAALFSSAVIAEDALTSDGPVMNLFKLDIKAGKTSLYHETAMANISASVTQEPGTLAMYSLKRAGQPERAWTIEIYASNEAYQAHLNSQPYHSFLQKSPQFIARKSQTALTPQFVGDKEIAQNANTINNLVIVEVKPEYQQAFSHSVLPEMAESLRVEKGVLAMYAATDVDNKNRWYFYEIYASEADYQRHRKTPHFMAYLEQTAAMTTRKESIVVVPHILRNKGDNRYQTP